MQDNHRIVLTPNAIKRHAKRLQIELKKLGHDYSLMQAHNLFAQIIGVENSHELDAIFNTQSPINMQSILSLKNDFFMDNILIEKLMPKTGLVLTCGHASQALTSSILQHRLSFKEENIVVTDDYSYQVGGNAGFMRIKSQIGKIQDWSIIKTQNWDAISTGLMNWPEDIQNAFDVVFSGNTVYAQIYKEQQFSSVYLAISEIISLNDMIRHPITLSFVEQLVNALSVVVSTRLVKRDTTPLADYAIIHEAVIFTDNIKKEILDSWSDNGFSDALYYAIERALEQQGFTYQKNIEYLHKQGVLTQSAVDKILLELS